MTRSHIQQGLPMPTGPGQRGDLRVAEAIAGHGERDLDGPDIPRRRQRPQVADEPARLGIIEETEAAHHLHRDARRMQGGDLRLAAHRDS